MNEIEQNKKVRVGVLALGNLGTAVAQLIAQNGNNVIAWEHQIEVVDEVNQQRLNSRYLSEITLSERLIATNDLKEFIAQIDIVFVTLPSRFIQPVLQPYLAAFNEQIAVVNMAKGIDALSGKTAFQLISQLLPKNPKAVVSGPSLANEFTRSAYTAVVAGSEHPILLQSIQRLMSNDYFKVATSNDVLGVELGGILKNIYALGYGVLVNEPSHSLNFSGAYLTLALKEMALLGEAMGANKQTFYELSGIGDLICTALSPHSHNRKLGELFSKGHSIKQAEIKMGILPESYNTLKTVLPIAREKKLHLPIAQSLMDGLDGKLSIDEFYQQILQ